MLSGNVGQGMPFLYSLLTLLQLTGTSQKEAQTLVWGLNFRNCYKGDISRLPDLEARKVYNCDPTGLYIVAYLKTTA